MQIVNGRNIYTKLRKRFTGVLLALALVTGIFAAAPPSAFATGITGIDVGAGNINVTGDLFYPDWEWDNSTNTFTLKGDIGPIRFYGPGDVNFVVNGAYAVESILQQEGKLSISGGGTLTMTNNNSATCLANVGLEIFNTAVTITLSGSGAQVGVSVVGDVTMSSGSLTVNVTSAGDPGINVTGNLDISGTASLSATANGVGIQVMGQIAVSGGSVTANSNSSDPSHYALVSGGNIDVTGGTLTTVGGSNGNLATLGSLNVSDPSATVIVNGGIKKINDNGGNLNVSAGTVTVVGAVEGSTIGSFGTTLSLTGTATISNANPRIGDTLTGSLENGNNTGTLSYQWKAGGSNTGTDSNTYTVRTADLDKTITLEITSSVETGTRTSTATAAVLKKAAPSAPSAPPTLVSKTHNSVTLTANALYEFSNDGTTWQTVSVFGGLNPNTPYTFYQRVAATDDTLASEASPVLNVTTDANALTGTATISNTAPRIGDTLTGSLVSGNNTGTLSYQWKVDGSNAGTDSDTYTVETADLSKEITLEIISSVETGTRTSTATAAVLKKAAPSAPSTPPTLVSKTHNSVTLTANDLYEFSNDGTAWQTSNIFGGLNPSTAYTFYQRFAETDDTLASAASTVRSVTTAAAPPILDQLNNVTIGSGSEWTNLDVDAKGTGWEWDAATKTLTLTGGLTDEIKIASETEEITVHIADNVNIPQITKTGNGALKITGEPGKILSVSNAAGPAISADGDIIIDSGTVQAIVTGADGTADTQPAIKAGGSVTVTGTSNVLASNSGTGADSGGTVSGGKTTISTGGIVNIMSAGPADAMNAAGGVEITGGTNTIDALGDGYAINAGNGNGTISITGGHTEITGPGDGTNPYPPAMSGANTVVIVNGQTIFGNPENPNNGGGTGSGVGCNAGTGAGTLAFLAAVLWKRRRAK